MRQSINRAIAFTHIVARVSPLPGSYADRMIVNAARKVSRSLERDGHIPAADLPPCPHPETATGLPIVKRNA